MNHCNVSPAFNLHCCKTLVWLWMLLCVDPDRPLDILQQVWLKRLLDCASRLTTHQSTSCYGDFRWRQSYIYTHSGGLAISFTSNKRENHKYPIWQIKKHPFLYLPLLYIEKITCSLSMQKTLNQFIHCKCIHLYF